MACTTTVRSLAGTATREGTEARGFIAYRVERKEWKRVKRMMQRDG